MVGYLGEGINGRMRTHPRIASDLSTGPVLAAGKRAAITGTVRWKALRTRVSFIQRATGGDVSIVTLRRCMMMLQRASEKTGGPE